MRAFRVRIILPVIVVFVGLTFAQAITISVTGPDGANGNPGSNGDPGTAGGDGGPGSPASANAAAPNDSSNSSTAIGGKGGSGGTGGNGAPTAPDVDADGGAGGNGSIGGDAAATASTILASAASTQAVAVARGGNGGGGGFGGLAAGVGTQGQGGNGGRGGDGNATADGSNATGSFAASANARGGSGGSTNHGGTPAAAGNAVASATATTSAASTIADSSSDATGGGGGGSSDFDGGVAQAGGTGTSMASANAAGFNGFANAHSIAEGGFGGGIAVSIGIAAKGGTANAFASGISGGGPNGVAQVRAEAHGGDGGNITFGGTSGSGGDAFATATGMNPGSAVMVTAIANAGAIGGLGSTGGSQPHLYGQSGIAIAHTTATGASGTATSSALSLGRGDFNRLTATAIAPVNGTVSTESRASIGTSPIDRSLATGISAAAFANAFPADAHNPLEEVFFSAAYPEDGNGASLLFRDTITLTPENITPDEVLALRFTGAVLTGAGFDLLHLSFSNDGVQLFDVTFTDVVAALAFFNSDQVYDLGPQGSNPFRELQFVYELTSNDPGAGFGVGALLGTPDSVPEPRTVTLVCVAIAFIFALRKTRPARRDQVLSRS